TAALRRTTQRLVSAGGRSSMECARIADTGSLFGRQQVQPRRPLVSGQSLIARVIPGCRIILERGAVGGGDSTFGRQGAGRRAAGDAVGADERGDRRAIFVVVHNVQPFPACSSAAVSS